MDKNLSTGNGQPTRKAESHFSLLSLNFTLTVNAIMNIDFGLLKHFFSGIVNIVKNWLAPWGMKRKLKTQEEIKNDLKQKYQIKNTEMRLNDYTIDQKFLLEERSNIGEEIQRIIALTQAEYDALSPQPRTLYVITDA